MGFEQLFRDRNNAMGYIFEIHVVFTSIELRVENRNIRSWTLSIVCGYIIDSKLVLT
jgi:hypothetical protein